MCETEILPDSSSTIQISVYELDQLLYIFSVPCGGSSMREGSSAGVHLFYFYTKLYSKVYIIKIILIFKDKQRGRIN